MLLPPRSLPIRLAPMTATALIGLAVLCQLAAVHPAGAQDTGLFLNIQPPGQDGYLNTADATVFLGTGVLPPHFDSQLSMYADIIKAPPGLTDAGLSLYFKPAPIAPSGNPPGPKDMMVPSDSKITITRDDFGVPHVEAKGRVRTWRGVGWAMAADRLFAMDLFRATGRGRLAERLGKGGALVTPELLDFALDQDESMYQFAGYDDADLDEQLAATEAEFKGKARKVEKDLEAFLSGVNAFADWVNEDIANRAPIESIALGLTPIQPFTTRDILAVAAVLEQLFGAGGGGEHRNATLLQELKAALGAGVGQAMFEDLRHREEPDSSATSELDFPYLVQGPVDPNAVALPDLGSIVSPPMIEIIGPLPAALSGVSVGDTEGLRTNPEHPAMSNFLGITAEHAAGGHPIAVMGPQVAYFIPALLTEISIDGGGLQARGMAVTGTPFVVLGRGPNYAWSATAGGSDLTDVRAELLCEPDTSPPSIMSNSSMFNGVCTPMFERLDSWCIGSDAFCLANGDNAQALVQRTGHGLVFARATVGGDPVALVKERSTFMREGQNALAFSRIDKKSTKKFKKFTKAVELLPGSFNWLYVNQDELGFVHSGRFPIRADGVDLELPSWGTGEWEWQGLVDKKARPQEVDPPKGYFTSWNNKPARAWRAADSNYSFGPVHRVDSLDDRVAAAVAGGSPIGVAEMVEMMAEAATTDLRGSQVLPHVLALIGSEAGLDPILTILSDWVANGAHRLDRDGNGEYDETSAVAIMDEWWNRMIDATLGPQIGPFDSSIPMGRHNAPGPLGSAFQSGYYGYVQKTVRMAAGDTVGAPYQELRCADGTSAGCRAALLASLGDTVAQLTADFGSADPADWIADPTDDFIEFTTFGIAAVDPIPWQNRPTFQQVVQVLSKKPF